MAKVRRKKKKQTFKEKLKVNKGGFVYLCVFFGYLLVLMLIVIFVGGKSNEKRNSNKETQSIVSTRVGENSTAEETTVVDNE